MPGVAIHLHNMLEEANITCLFCYSRRVKPTVGDVFIGYHADAAASVVLQVCTKKENDGENDPRLAVEVRVLRSACWLVPSATLSDAFHSALECERSCFAFRRLWRSARECCCSALYQRR